MKAGLFCPMIARQAAGPETYERCLVEAIARSDLNHQFHIYCLGETAAEIVRSNEINQHVHTLWPPLRPLSIAISLPLLVKKQGIDLLHATFIPAPVMPVNYVFTVHDISPFTHPEYYPAAIHKRLTYLMRRGLKHAKVILCISEHARDTTADYFGIPEERLAVAYHGVDRRFRPIAQETAWQNVSQAYAIHSPYILYLGKLEARKNIQRLLEAFLQFRQQTDSKHTLVLAGRRHQNLPAINQLLNHPDLRGHVIETGFVEAARMPELYSGADFFVFPSLWEGFGLPILEAMACGTPVITSNTTCLPEIAGDAALLVNPDRSEDIAAAMARLASDETLRNELRERGVIRATQFTWKQTATQTLAAYRQALA